MDKQHMECSYWMYILKRDYNLDIFWLENTSSIDRGDSPALLDLAHEAAQRLEAALDSVNKLIIELRDVKNALK